MYLNQGREEGKEVMSKKLLLFNLLLAIVILSISGCVKPNNSPKDTIARVLGGFLFDYGYDVKQTSDGGYIVAGYTYSNDGDVSGNHGYFDYWIVKIDGTGNIQWQKCLGGSGYDNAYDIEQTSDGGYIVAGATYSNDGDVSGNHGSCDYWVVKLGGDD